MATETLEPISTRVPAEIVRKLQKIAEDERRPIAHVTRFLIEDGLALREKKPPKKQ